MEQLYLNQIEDFDVMGSKGKEIETIVASRRLKIATESTVKSVDLFSIPRDDLVMFYLENSTGGKDHTTCISATTARQSLWIWKMKSTFSIDLVKKYKITVHWMLRNGPRHYPQLVTKSNYSGLKIISIIQEL